MKNLFYVLSLMLLTGTAQAYVLATPAYDFSNGTQRNIIKRSTNEFLDKITKDTPCMVQMTYLNDSSFVHLDRNSLVDITIINKGKSVYYKQHDITRENFISNMTQLKYVVDDKCKK